MNRMKAAVKAYIRLSNEFYEQAEQYEEADRHFDGGEWSGPAWAKLYEEKSEQLFNSVAEKFQVDVVELGIAFHEYIYDDRGNNYSLGAP